MFHQVPELNRMSFQTDMKQLGLMKNSCSCCAHWENLWFELQKKDNCAWSGETKKMQSRAHATVAQIVKKMMMVYLHKWII